MLIIFGMRVRSKRLASGTFACPSCGADRAYAHFEARRWFTLFFLPIIPLKVVGEYLECETCHHKFRTDVLTAPTTGQLQDQLLAIVREGAVLVLGTEPSPTARQEARSLVSAFAGREWTDDDLDADRRQLDPSQISARLATIAPILNEQGKERLVAGFTQIAATGGVLGAEDRRTIERLAGEIGMTSAHTRGVIDEVLERV